MPAPDVVICKCGVWNRVRPTSKPPSRIVCCNCGNQIISVVGGGSGPVVRGEPIVSPAPPSRQRRSGGGGVPIGLLITLLSLVIGGVVSSMQTSPVAIRPIAPQPVPAPPPPLLTIQVPPPIEIPAAVVMPPAGVVAPPHRASRAAVGDALPAPPPALSLPPPRTGAIQQGRRKNRIALFSVEGSAGTNYLIKLINVSDAKDQFLIFVRGGEKYSTKVPLGTYRLRAAAGTTWYGKDELFGPSTYFFQLRKKAGTSGDDRSLLRFYRQGRTIYGTTLNFKPVEFGNLEQETISKDEFMR